MIVHLIGPGGAGKTTTASLLCHQAEFEKIDLDEYFIKYIGDIADYIQKYGYEKYAQANIQNYLNLRKNFIHSKKTVIFVCSSGFMTYPEATHREYTQIKYEIEHNPLTFLLIPSLRYNQCVQEIIQRQFRRTDLKADDVRKEKEKIKKRFFIYTKLKCKIVLTNEVPFLVACRLKHEISQLKSIK